MMYRVISAPTTKTNAQAFIFMTAVSGETRRDYMGIPAPLLTRD
jgi:hypothetical protein